MATNVEALRFNQEEADNRIILHCLDSNAIITVRSPDTDVFILLLHVTSSLEQTVLFDTRTGDKRRLINVKQVVGNALYSFTGCDTISTFVRKGQLVPLKTLKRNKDFIDVFLKLGRSPDIEEQTYEKLEHFVCIMYNKRAPTRMRKFRLWYTPFVRQVLLSLT